LRKLVWPAVVVVFLVLSWAGCSRNERSAKPQLEHALQASRDLRAEAVLLPPALVKQACLVPLDETSEHRDHRGTKIVYAQFATMDQANRYSEARPWFGAYSPSDDPLFPNEPSFPAIEDAPTLRDALSDPDPAIRSLAIEALAVLDQPEDIARIAALLDDGAEGAPSLEYNYLAGATYVDRLTAGGRGHDDPNAPLIRRSWRTKTVGEYARRAIRYMTGRDLDSRAFAAWWKVNSNCRHCLWYWQQRISHQLRAVDYTRKARAPSTGQRRTDTADRKARAAIVRQEIIRIIGPEVRKEPAEVEAKVKLLALDTTVSNGFASDPPTPSIFPAPLHLRAEPEVLLEVLEGKRHWPDIDLEYYHERGIEYYNLLATRMALSPEIFRRDHIGRLRSILAARNPSGARQLRSSGRAAILVRISRLLPPASSGDLDNPNTRDGTLRTALRNESDGEVISYLVRELRATQLPANIRLADEVQAAHVRETTDIRLRNSRRHDGQVEQAKARSSAPRGRQ